MSMMLIALTLSTFAEGETSLTILFTHDMHDNLEPHQIELNGKVQTRGGFARLSTAIKEERTKDENLLLLDAGDYSMGTLYQTIYETHSPALRLMGLMGYDATTFGNHEYDFRSEGLTHSLTSALKSEDPLPQIIASNTSFPEDSNEALIELKESFEEFGVKNYTVIEKNGLKIGVIGLMGKEADSNAPMAEVDFNDMVESSKETVKILKEEEKVDLIVAVSHSGTDGKRGKSEDEQLAKKVPEINVIISGHSHTTLVEPIMIGNTVIASSGRYAENLGTMKLNKVGDTWELQNYEIKPITEKFKDDPAIQKKINGFKTAVEEEYLSRFDLNYKDIIAYSPFGFTPALDLADKQEEEPLGYLIGDAYRYAVKNAEKENYKHIDVAVVPSGVIRDSFTKGNITVEDIFKVSPLGIGKDKLSGYPLIDVYLTGKELKTAAEVDASIQPIMSTAQLYMSGMEYSFNPHRIIFNKITDTKIRNEENELVEIEDKKLYRVVANLYSAQMLNIVGDQSKGLLSIVPKDENGNVVTNFEDRIVYENGEEVKEWLALTHYLQSGEKDENNIPQVDMKYSQKQGFKMVNPDRNIIEILKNPNKISLGIMGILASILAIIIFISRKIHNRTRRYN